jgi:hypothetical protein
LKDWEVGIEDNPHNSALNSIFVRVRFGEGSSIVVGELQREIIKGLNDEAIFECGVFVAASIDDLTGRLEGEGES